FSGCDFVTGVEAARRCPKRHCQSRRAMEKFRPQNDVRHSRCQVEIVTVPGQPGAARYARDVSVMRRGEGGSNKRIHSDIIETIVAERMSVLMISRKAGLSPRRAVGAVSKGRIH